MKRSFDDTSSVRPGRALAGRLHSATASRRGREDCFPPGRSSGESALLGSSSDVLWVTGRGAAAFEPIKHGLIVAAARCGDVQRLGFWAIDLAPLAAPTLAEEISVAFPATSDFRAGG